VADNFQEWLSGAIKNSGATYHSLALACGAENRAWVANKIRTKNPSVKMTAEQCRAIDAHLGLEKDTTVQKAIEHWAANDDRFRTANEYWQKRQEISDLERGVLLRQSPFQCGEVSLRLADSTQVTLYCVPGQGEIWGLKIEGLDTSIDVEIYGDDLDNMIALLQKARALHDLVDPDAG